MRRQMAFYVVGVGIYILFTALATGMVALHAFADPVENASGDAFILLGILLYMVVFIVPSRLGRDSIQEELRDI